MSSDTDIDGRVELKASKGEFLGQMIILSSTDSAGVQDEFIDEVAAAVKAFRAVFVKYDLVRSIDYAPSKYWPSVSGKAFGFIDGGVANIDLPTAAPLGLRVGSYVVRPGVEASDREDFQMELTLVDELFGANPAVYAELDEDIDKLRDVARMVAEVSAACKVAARISDLSALLVHGPLVNPVAPYGLDGFPHFTDEAASRLLDDSSARSVDEKSFIPIYLELLEKLASHSAPVAGVVERSISKKATFFEACLNRLLDDGRIKRKTHKDLLDKVLQYFLSDVDIFDLMLSPGEFIRPFCVDRQGPERKWPNKWKSWIRTYPKPETTFLKPSEENAPFRVETFDSGAQFEVLVELIYHTTRLLPRYSFPVGLDIVDKFAKVPSWMTRSVRGQHATILLKKALASGDSRMIAYAKRVLAARGRDWFFRPKA